MHNKRWKRGWNITVDGEEVNETGREIPKSDLSSRFKKEATAKRNRKKKWNKHLAKSGGFGSV